MSQGMVKWQEIEQLGKTLGDLGPEFSRDDKKALAFVFEVARATLTGERQAVPFDARFIPCEKVDDTRELFKIESLFREDPVDDHEKVDQEPPEPKSSKE